MTATEPRPPHVGEPGDDARPVGVPWDDHGTPGTLSDRVPDTGRGQPDRVAAMVEAARARREFRHAVRADLATARRIGLRRRHAAKLARLRAAEPPDTDGPA